MKVTFDSTLTPNCYQIIVLAKVSTETFTIGKLMFDTTEQWEEAKNKLMRDMLHPSEELVKVMKKKFKPYSSIKEEDIRNAYIEFVFVDNVPVIEF